MDDPRLGREEQALSGQWPWGRVGDWGWGGARCWGLWRGRVQSLGTGNTLGSLTCAIRIGRRDRDFGQFAEAIFREIMAKSFSKLKRHLCPQIQETQENYTQGGRNTQPGVTATRLNTEKTLKHSQRERTYCYEANIN